MEKFLKEKAEIDNMVCKVFSELDEEIEVRKWGPS